MSCQVAHALDAPPTRSRAWCADPAALKPLAHHPILCMVRKSWPLLSAVQAVAVRVTAAVWAAAEGTVSEGFSQR